jgi:hypothetical protein
MRKGRENWVRPFTQSGERAGTIRNLEPGRGKRAVPPPTFPLGCYRIGPSAVKRSCDASGGVLAGRFRRFFAADAIRDGSLRSLIRQRKVQARYGEELPTVVREFANSQPFAKESAGQFARKVRPNRPVSKFFRKLSRHTQKPNNRHVFY